MFKQISHNSDWLNEIDGSTVKEAIEYLQALNPGYRLNTSMTGDTHGCNIETSLIEDVLMTDEEEQEFLITSKIRKLKEELKKMNSSVEYYEKDAIYYAKQGKEFPERMKTRLLFCKERIIQINAELNQYK
jgi:hypothetical protein